MAARTRVDLAFFTQQNVRNAFQVDSPARHTAQDRCFVVCCNGIDFSLHFLDCRESCPNKHHMGEDLLGWIDTFSPLQGVVDLRCTAQIPADVAGWTETRTHSGADAFCELVTSLRRLNCVVHAKKQGLAFKLTDYCRAQAFQVFNRLTLAPIHLCTVQSQLGN